MRLLTHRVTRIVLEWCTATRRRVREFSTNLRQKSEGYMQTYDYDVLVVGAGQGGLPAAHMAANLGAKVALIEEREVGGT